MRIYNTVPEFTLTGESGADVRSADALAGKVWVANFIYTTCPGPCPRTTRQMALLQTKFEQRADVRLVSFTVDPENDTPSTLAAYAQRYGAKPGRWMFFTGSKQLLDNLSREVFLLHSVDGKGSDHSTRFVLVDRKGQIRKYYDSVEASSMDELASDAATLLAETS